MYTEVYAERTMLSKDGRSVAVPFFYSDFFAS